LLAPVLPFTADEIWQHLHGDDHSSHSVHTELFPDLSSFANNSALARWEPLFQLREEVSKKLEDARQAKMIGTSLEAQLLLVCGKEKFEYLRGFSSDLRYIFIVSEVALEESAGLPPDHFEVRVSPAAGEKCERCWNYTSDIGADGEFPSICGRCVAALKETGEGK
jgi:isoleucyl-tRNA synthetase